MKRNKLFTFLLALSVAIFSFIFIFATTSKAKAAAVVYSADSTLWADSTGATFSGNQMSATTGSFNWKTNKLTDDLAVDFTVTESLAMSAFADWKWEYLTINTTGETGIDAAGGTPASKSSVSVVWGWTTGLSLVVKDAEGNVVYNKMAATEASDTTFVPGNAGTDAEIVRQTPYYNYDKAFNFKVNVTKVETGVKFDFEVITKSPWGHNIDWTFSYTSDNKDFAGDKYLVYGRAGSGTVDEDHKILVDLSIDSQVSTVRFEGEPVKYSADSTLWADSTGAAFSGSQMSATTAQFNWKTNKITDDLAVDFTTTESLELNATGDWKWEYLTINTSGETGIDAGGGVPASKSSVTLVWGWVTEFSLVEKDAEGNVVYNKKAALADSDTTFAITDNKGNTDAAFFSNTSFNLFDKAFTVKVNVVKIETGVRFDYQILTKSPWGHDIDWTFSYTSTNKDFAGDKYLVYGRAGSGTVDETHKILVDLAIGSKASDVEFAPEVVEDNITFAINNKSFTSLTGKHLFNEVTNSAATYTMLIYTKTTEIEAITCNGDGVAIVLDKFGRLDRVYDGANGKFFDAENPSGKTGAGFGGGDYATYAYTQLQAGETLIIFPNDGVNGADSPRTFGLGLRMDGSIGKFATLTGFTFKEYVEGAYTYDAANFVTLSSAGIDDNGLYLSAYNGKAITKPFGGNATIKFVADNTKLAAMWGGLVFMFKGTASEMNAVQWSFDPATNTLNPSSTTGSWVALMMTHGTYKLLHCENGVVTEINANLGLDGLSFWYVMEQINTLTVTTTDTADGVDFELTFKASGYASSKNQDYTVSFSVADKSLWGEQSAYYTMIIGEKAPEQGNNSLLLVVSDTASSYNKDMYKAGLFKDALAAITYDAITADNYSSIVTAYNNATALYNALTDEQKALITDTETTRFNTIKSDLENVDVAVLAKLAIAALPTEAFTRANYEANKAKVEDAKAKYNQLSDEQKATFTAEEKAALTKAIDDLDEYEDILKYADPVVALIQAISLPITNYGQTLRAIEKAKAEYDKLYDVEKAEVYNYADLTAALTALAEYEAAHTYEGYNFATNQVNFAEVQGYDAFTATEKGLAVNSSDNQAGFYITKKVGDKQSITFVIDSRLDDSGWGNYYFVFKSDSLTKRHNAGSWDQNGNYCVLLIGGDGFKIVECVNGELPMTTDAAGNPFANWQTVLDYPTDEEGANQYDIFYIYKQFTVVTIETEDLYDGDTYKGFKATITLVGGNSGVTITREYTSTNTYSEGAQYAGLELFVGKPINGGNGDGFSIKGIYVEGVDTYDGAAVKAQMVKEQHAKACDQLLGQLITTITVENYTEAKGYYQAAKAAYDALTDDEKALLTVDAIVLGTVEAAIEAYEAQLTPGTQPPVTQPPVTQPPVTQAPATQAPVTQAPQTQAPATQAPATQTEPSETGKKKGCKSFVESLPIFALLLVPAAAVVIRRRKESE